MVNKDKLISFPEQILEKLEEYKQKTGIPATDYIRDCVARKMIGDGLIWINIKYVDVEVKRNGNKKKKPDMTDAIESNKFCSADGKCEDPRPVNDRC
ncbi:MAG: ribbon-helix-helix domain-containing protein [Saprospiraceae bacterium]